MNRRKINYAEAAEKEMREVGLHFSSEKKGQDTNFSIPMPAENVPCLHVKLRVSEDGDSKLWCFLANKVKPAKRAAMLETLNTLNDKYRFLRLSLDKDNDVCADYDFAMFGDEAAAGEQTMTTLLLMVDIMDHCIEPIMRTMWGTDTVKDTGDEPAFNMNLFDDDDEEIDEDDDNEDFDDEEEGDAE